MSFDDFIGFLISFLAFIYLILRGVSKQSQNENQEQENDFDEENEVFIPPFKKTHPYKERLYHKSEEPIELPKLKDFYQSPLIPFKSTYKPKEKPAELNYYSNLPSYDVIRKNEISSSNQLIKGLKSKKEMVIFKEILDRPKGFF